MEYKRVTLFCGHYGSGKTNIAVNYAVELKNKGFDVIAADLDIVNPYFRTKDSEDFLNKHGIRLICSQFANSNLDVPAMPKESYSLFSDKAYHAVVDVGGDDRGALALGRYVNTIKEENDYEMLFVFNCSRPLTRTADDAISVMEEIEASCRLKFTGIVNNSNIGKESDAGYVLKSLSKAKELSDKTGLPIKMTSVKKELYSELNGKIENLFPLRLQELYYEIKE